MLHGDSDKSNGGRGRVKQEWELFEIQELEETPHELFFESLKTGDMLFDMPEKIFLLALPELNREIEKLRARE